MVHTQLFWGLKKCKIFSFTGSLIAFTTHHPDRVWLEILAKIEVDPLVCAQELLVTCAGKKRVS